MYSTIHMRDVELLLCTIRGTAEKRVARYNGRWMARRAMILPKQEAPERVQNQTPGIFQTTIELFEARGRVLPM